jgi:hypothetical protein
MFTHTNNDTSSKVLLNLCERLGSQTNESDLDTLHGCLSARLLLLRNLPVRDSDSLMRRCF